eukprot:scaffold597_cov176-Amphora_coffeaeformis.AAC.15
MSGKGARFFSSDSTRVTLRSIMSYMPTAALTTFMDGSSTTKTFQLESLAVCVCVIKDRREIEVGAK